MNSEQGPEEYVQGPPEVPGGRMKWGVLRALRDTAEAYNGDMAESMHHRFGEERAAKYSKFVAEGIAHLNQLLDD